MIEDLYLRVKLGRFNQDESRELLWGFWGETTNEVGGERGG